MSQEWEKTLPQELQDYIEAERQAARAGAIAELRLGKINLLESVRPKAQPAEHLPTEGLTTEGLPSGRELRSGIGKRVPRGVGRNMVIDFWAKVSPSEILTLTQVQQHLYAQSGVNVSLQTITRAMDQLNLDGKIEKIKDTEGWRIVPKLRSVQ